MQSFTLKFAVPHFTGDEDWPEYRDVMTQLTKLSKLEYVDLRDVESSFKFFDEQASHLILILSNPGIVEIHFPGWITRAPWFIDLLGRKIAESSSIKRIFIYTREKHQEWNKLEKEGVEIHWIASEKIDSSKEDPISREELIELGKEHDLIVIRDRGRVVDALSNFGEKKENELAKLPPIQFHMPVGMHSYTNIKVL